MHQQVKSRMLDVIVTVIGNGSPRVVTRVTMPTLVKVVRTSNLAWRSYSSLEELGNW
jgi:hypothetical protein